MTREELEADELLYCEQCGEVVTPTEAVEIDFPASSEIGDVIPIMVCRECATGGGQ